MNGGAGLKLLAVFGVIAIVIIAGLVGLFVYGKNSVAPACEDFMTKIEAGDYELAYASIGKRWRDIQPEDEFTGFWESINGKLGKCVSKKVTGVHISKNSGITTATLNYTATFEKGVGDIEFSLEKVGGEWVVIGAHYNSPALLDLLKCPHCGAIQTTIVKFCSQCGKPMSADDGEEETDIQPIETPEDETPAMKDGETMETPDEVTPEDDESEESTTGDE